MLKEISDNFIKDYLYELIEEFFYSLDIEIVSNLKIDLTEAINEELDAYITDEDPYGIKFFSDYALAITGCEKGMISRLIYTDDIIAFYVKYRTELDTLYSVVANSTKISKLKRLITLGKMNLSNVIKLYVWQLVDYIILDIGKSYIKSIDVKYTEYIVDRFEYD